MFTIKDEMNSKAKIIEDQADMKSIHLKARIESAKIEMKSKFWDEDVKRAGDKIELLQDQLKSFREQFDEPFKDQINALN